MVSVPTGLGCRVGETRDDKAITARVMVEPDCRVNVEIVTGAVKTCTRHSRNDGRILQTGTTVESQFALLNQFGIDVFIPRKCPIFQLVLFRN